jgi:hypothetical protein
MILVNAPYFSATNLFDTERMARLVEWARANFDQVVLDLPPIVGLADGRYLAALADVVIFVIKWNSTPLSAARSARRASGHRQAARWRARQRGVRKLGNAGLGLLLPQPLFELLQRRQGLSPERILTISKRMGPRPCGPACRT